MLHFYANATCEPTCFYWMWRSSSLFLRLLWLVNAAACGQNCADLDTGHTGFNSRCMILKDGWMESDQPYGP